MPVAFLLTRPSGVALIVSLQIGSGILSVSFSPFHKDVLSLPVEKLISRCCFGQCQVSGSFNPSMDYRWTTCMDRCQVCISSVPPIGFRSRAL